MSTKTAVLGLVIELNELKRFKRKSTVTICKKSKDLLSYIIFFLLENLNNDFLFKIAHFLVGYLY